MELQTCLLITTLVTCGAEIRPAGWLDKVVAHWKNSFIDDFGQLAPFNLDASIVPAPPGYKDSPDWDFDSVSRMLALLSVSETGQPALNSLRRMIAPTRRMMMDVPGLAASYIPESLYNSRRSYYWSGPDQRGMRNDRKRKANNRMRTNNRKDMADHRMGMANNRMGMANNRMGMANNRMGMSNNRMGMANNRMGMANNRMGMAYERMGSQGGYGIKSRKQMLEKRIIEKQLSDFQMSFGWFPSIKDRVPGNIYYDQEPNSYEDATEDYEFVDPLAVSSEDDAIVLLKNPVEARLPSARISVKLLKEILEARAKAARVMPSKKTTLFSWNPMDMTTPLNNGASDDNSTVAADSTAPGGIDKAPTTVGGGDAGGGGAGAAATTPGGGGGDVATTVAADAAEAPPPEPEGRKMAAKDQ